MSRPQIAVVDYGAGNILNVLRALEYLEVQPQLVSAPESVSAADGIVIPGVGAFGAGMRGLRSTGMDQALRESVVEGIPILAICLGMQLLASSSEESPAENGLNLIPGKVLKLGTSTASPARVPDTGWASVTFSRSTLGVSAGDTRDFYFSHSYYFSPTDRAVVSGSKIRESAEVPVLLEHNNIVAAQFHPEKSGKEGISLLQSWIQNCKP